jgi:hypothetical protein
VRTDAAEQAFGIISLNAAGATTRIDAEGEIASDDALCAFSGVRGAFSGSGTVTPTITVRLI